MTEGRAAPAVDGGRAPHPCILYYTYEASTNSAAAPYVPSYHAIIPSSAAEPRTFACVK